MSTTANKTDPRVEQRVQAMEARLEERERELAAAEEAERRARLRAAAEAQVAAEQAEEERRAQLEQLAAELPGRVKAVDVDKAERKMAEAIEAYVAACKERGTIISEAWDVITRARSAGPVPGMSAEASSGAVTVAGETFRQPTPQRGIYDAAAAALREHYPRFEIRLNGS